MWLPFSFGAIPTNGELPYAVITQFGCFNYRVVYLGCRQAEETVFIRRFLATASIALQKVPYPCVVTPVLVLYELVSTTQQTCIVPFPCRACEL